MGARRRQALRARRLTHRGLAGCVAGPLPGYRLVVAQGAGGSGRPGWIQAAGNAAEDVVEPGRETVARLLAAIAGYVDAVGYIALFRLFTAHQSGNSAGLGAALATADWTAVWKRSTAIGAFLLGVIVGSVLVEIGRRRRGRSGVWVAVAEMAALGGALVVGDVAAHAGRLPPSETAAYAVAAACLAGAMGLQTVTLRRVGRRAVRTTFVTGLLTNLAETIVVACFERDAGDRRSLLSWWRLLGSLWLLYLGGAVAGGFAVVAWSFTALVPPMAMVAAVAMWEVRSGYQPTLPGAR